MEAYSKKPLNIDAQLQLLVTRGLLVEEVAAAKLCLLNIGYFRLASYGHVLLADKLNLVYKKGSTFEQMVAIYEADSKLRHLIFEAIATIEIALRTKLSYYFGVAQNDPCWFENAQNFTSRFNLVEFLTGLDDDVKRSHEEFVVAHKSRYGYGERNRMPTWKSLEVISFGKLSRLLAGLNPGLAETKEIVSAFGLYDHGMLCSWIHLLVVVRNICGHHGRLWNRRFAIRPRILRPASKGWLRTLPNKVDQDKIYLMICCISYMQSALGIESNICSELKSFLERYPILDPAAMGFPLDWDNEPMWQ
jgi:abortive infection bacteriophage resistance protein